MGRIPLLLTWIVLTGWAAARQQAPALPAELSDSEFWQLIVDTSEPDGYLASSESFDHIRAMQRRNLIVPVVGDFAGPKALRALGAYVRARGGTVNVFYASNVEANLFRAGTWKAFYENVGTMPVHDAGVLVRTFFGATARECSGQRPTIRTPVLGSMTALLAAHRKGELGSQCDLVATSK